MLIIWRHTDLGYEQPCYWPSCAAKMIFGNVHVFLSILFYLPFPVTPITIFTNLNWFHHSCLPYGKTSNDEYLIFLNLLEVLTQDTLLSKRAPVKVTHLCLVHVIDRMLTTLNDILAFVFEPLRLLAWTFCFPIHVIMRCCGMVGIKSMLWLMAFKKIIT